MDPPAPPRGAGRARMNPFAIERLPEDPVPAVPRRRSRLAALFAPEKLEDPQ
jgi:hypothetical protein